MKLLPVSTLCKVQLIKSVVRPIIKFTSPIWDPHTLLNINRLVTIQRFATRFCYNGYVRTSSVTSMLNKLNLPSLEERRFHSKSIMMYKILNNLIDIPTHYFVPNHLHWEMDTLLNCPPDLTLLSFIFPSIIKIWNT